jgi:hypothetical protein
LKICLEDRSDFNRQNYFDKDSSNHIIEDFMSVPPIALPPAITTQAAPSSPAAVLGRMQAQGSIDSAAISSPKIDSPAAPRIAQELPGGNTSPSTPPSPNSSFPQSSDIPANYIGVGASFSGGATGLGAISRFAWSRNISIRPSATFGNGRSTVRLPITYDFYLGDPEPFESNPLASFHAGGGVEFTSAGGTVQGDRFGLLGTVGVDLNLFTGVAILADFNTNFSDNTGATLGVGFEF